MTSVYGTGRLPRGSLQPEQTADARIKLKRLYPSFER
jgi:hypothetical protein